MRSCCKRPDHALHDLLQDREDKLRELLPHEQIILPPKKACDHSRKNISTSSSRHSIISALINIHQIIFSCNDSCCIFLKQLYNDISLQDLVHSDIDLL